MTDTTARRRFRTAGTRAARLALAGLVTASLVTTAHSSAAARAGMAVQQGSAASATAPSEVQRRFVGNWRLVTFENFDEQGRSSPNALDVGRIMYDAEGNMAAHLMRTERKPMSTPATDAERAASYASYVAYFGRYTIDTSNNSVTHHVEGSLNPNWVKTPLVRYWQFSPDGNRLMLSVRNAAGRTTGTLTWERLR
jgi:hypothetical protein